MYQYDKGGNRVSEKIYNYTLTDTLGTVQQEIVSEYDNLVWDDLLTSYNGKAITYDNAGNPLTYDGQTYTWDGKQLKEIIAQDGSKTVFDYDANGIRTRKIQYNAEGGIDYFVDYVWSDGKIVSQLLVATLRGTSNNEPIEVAIGPIASKVVYDDNGIPQGFTCGSACFGFVRNLQGDVIALVDYDGNIVAEYSYDPWGNIEYHISEDVNEVEALIITALCPLTYRGYNYDFSTGLYYLQSRYYNPEWGRFLNCDDTAILLSTQGQTHNANLFAYCNNNPINNIDLDGRKSKKLTANDGFVYGLIAYAALEYDFNLRKFSWILQNKDLSSTVNVDKNNIITINFVSTFSEGLINKTRYVFSVQVGVVKDWYNYAENGLDNLAKPDWWDEASFGVDLLAGVGALFGLGVPSLVSLGVLFVTKPVSTATDHQVAFYNVVKDYLYEAETEKGVLKEDFMVCISNVYKQESVYKFGSGQTTTSSFLDKKNSFVFATEPVIYMRKEI